LEPYKSYRGVFAGQGADCGAGAAVDAAGAGAGVARAAGFAADLAPALGAAFFLGAIFFAGCGAAGVSSTVTGLGRNWVGLPVAVTGSMVSLSGW